MSKFNNRDNAGLKVAVTWAGAIKNKHGTLLWDNRRGGLKGKTINDKVSTSRKCRLTRNSLD